MTGRKSSVVACFLTHSGHGRGTIGRRRRRNKVELTDDWEQLDLLCVWEEQREYERIRPLVRVRRVLASTSPVAVLLHHVYRLEYPLFEKGRHRKTQGHS